MTAGTLFAALSWVVAEDSADTAQRDKNLNCHRCGLRIATVEHGDSLETLARTALMHRETACQRRDDTDHDDHDGGTPQ